MEELLMSENRACSYPGCGYAHYAFGLCLAHYRMKGRGQDLRPVNRRFAHVGCIVEGCPRPHRSKGLCTPHYARQQRGHALGPIEVPERHTVCKFPGPGGGRGGKQWPVLTGRWGREEAPCWTEGERGEQRHGQY
jgi:hypothetical protein